MPSGSTTPRRVPTARFWRFTIKGVTCCSTKWRAGIRAATRKSGSGCRSYRRRRHSPCRLAKLNALGDLRRVERSWPRRSLRRGVFRLEPSGKNTRTHQWSGAQRRSARWRCGPRWGRRHDRTWTEHLDIQRRRCCNRQAGCSRASEGTERSSSTRTTR